MSTDLTAPEWAIEMARVAELGCSHVPDEDCSAYVGFTCRTCVAFMLAKEREECMRAVCRQCAKGAPISDADECMSLGHFHHADTCHPFSWDDKGRVDGHIHCEAAAIRART